MNDKWKECIECGYYNIDEEIYQNECDKCGGKMKRVKHCDICNCFVFPKDYKEHRKQCKIDHGW